MPSYNITLKSDEVDLFIEEMQARESQVDVVVPTTLAEKENSSSSTTQDAGESSSISTFASNYAILPDNIKSVLDYCSFVTERYPTGINRLVRLLVAEGLVPKNPRDIIEDVAANIMKALISLGMLQESIEEREVQVLSPYRKLSISRVERGSFVAKAENSSFRFLILDNGQGIPAKLNGLPIESLFVITAERRGLCKFGDVEGRLSRAYLETICKLKYLLVLDLYGAIECLPDEVGDLVHLTYLGLYCSYLNELPRSIGNLQKLQTLDIRACGKLQELPIEVLDIQQLRHLLMSKCIDGSEIRVPKRIETMLNLQTLCGVYAGGGIANALGNLTQLRKLEVLRVSDDHASELSAAIMKMVNLVSLALEAEGDLHMDFDNDDPALFPELELFSPPPLLQELNLTGILVEMPNWLSTTENLTRLSLSFSYLPDYSTSIIQLLPQLKYLNLWQASKAKLIGKEFCEAGGFPKLETLTIASDFLVEWTEIVNGSFPSLRSLSFRNCTCLRFLPDGLQHISTLEVLKVLPLYEHDLQRRLGGKENYKIKNIPNVLFWALP